ncbi:type IV inositol polyphosphate 5-phosphatase 3 isoform X1 [Salvia hispanica]|uniref:type IV inositol polyphosphate 5-phosphatase 3 isoform X1 n=1 Tax=Salvia hispanica TaxID=49212 RepID=UPI00200952AC|nr:type IV inositol polyphosphate 5-phosphatase 3 isoform X1 [Salvia hispanica]XP_047956564.1 type IV inositol polyphosphate 5-phosphatase 3 isoform X1 [Salvia hispanica]
MRKINSRTHHPHQQQQHEKNWAEILCFACACLQLSWKRLVVRKWLNIATSNSDYSADTDTDSDSESEITDYVGESRFKNEKLIGLQVDAADALDALPRLRRRKSETFRAQYIDTKEIRVCAATWNVGGRIPPDDIDLDDWLDIDNPADVYVIGLQEIIPLNAGNIFGAEDNRPVSKWENLIRETLNQVPPATKFKSYSDPPSPSKYKPSEDAPDIEEEILLESDSDVEEEIHPLNEDPNVFEEIEDRRVIGDDFVCADPSVSNGHNNSRNSVNRDLQRQLSSPKMLDRLYFSRTGDSEESADVTDTNYNKKLTRTISGTERIGLSWPEPPLNLLGQHVFDRHNSFKSSKSFKTSKSFRTYSSFKSTAFNDNRIRAELASLAELDLESLINRKRRPSYVRIISKQMVGIFVTIWVRRSLRKHIQNLKVSTVGVGIMGYIGNKGSISVSMSIHQTFFCFICTHLTSGEKEGDANKRNNDVHEIHRRTHFNSLAGLGHPKKIYDHERIIWLGDLNYRINLPFERTRELISKKDWSKLVERDQLSKEFRKGRAFDGWSEGTLTFAPTYKYEFNSDSYSAEEPKAGRRTPAWCDRILSYGTGMKLLSYKRSECKLSDHRPVTASYMVEVEVFSPRKLQRALTYTDAEIEQNEIVTEMGLGADLNQFLLEEATYHHQKMIGLDLVI